MNLSEIRAKYPQYDNISNAELTQRLHQKFYPQMDYNDFADAIGYKRTDREADYVAEKLTKEMMEEGRTEPNWKDYGKAALYATGYGLGDIGKTGTAGIARGFTYGGSNLFTKDTPLDTSKVAKDMEDNYGWAGKAANLASDTIGIVMSPITKTLGLGAGAVLSKLPKEGIGNLISQLGTSSVAGGVGGGLYGGLSSGSIEGAKKGALRGAILAPVINAALMGINNTFSAAQAAKGVPRNLEGAMRTTKGRKLFDRAAKQDIKTAERIRGEVPDTLEKINNRSIDRIDSAIGKTDIKGNIRSAGKAKGDFIEQSGSTQVVKSPNELGIKNISPNDKKVVLDAWNKSKWDLLPNEKVGSLKHIDRMNGYLNDEIRRSLEKSESSILPKPTAQTSRLESLKSRIGSNISEKMDATGLKDLNKAYAQAKAVEESYNRGLNYRPTNIKAQDINFKTPEEAQAFGQGLAKQIKVSPETRSVSDAALDKVGALRRVVGDKANDLIKGLNEDSLAYQATAGLKPTTYRPLAKADPMAGNAIRESVDSIMTPAGSLADKVNKIITIGKANRAANMILDGKEATPLYDMVAPNIPSLTTVLFGSSRRKGE